MHPIDGDALLKEANADGAYGYVSAEQIANAPTIEPVPAAVCGKNGKRGKSMRLIDADELAEKARPMEALDGEGIPYTVMGVYLIAIEDAPTIEAEPIIPAFWKPIYESEISGYDPALAGRDPVGAYVCTNCGAEAIFDCNEQFVLSERCHKCGAHMDAPEPPKEDDEE